MSPRCLALIAVVVAAYGCASPTLPTPSLEAPTLAPRATAAIAPPIPTPTTTPTRTPTPTPSPTQSPVGLHVGALATVTADKLRQFADPADPNNHAWKSPYGFGNAGRILAAVTKGQHVYILDQALVDGGPYWKIADSPYAGCCAPFGWIPASSHGSETLSPYAPSCPAADKPFTTTEFFSFADFVQLVCFGSADVQVSGLMSCGQAIVDAGAFPSSPWVTRPDQPYTCSFDRYQHDLDSDFFKPWSEQSGIVGNVILTGHFNDPRSSQCHWTAGDYENFVPPEGGPAETAEFTCRMQYVVTDLAIE